MRINRWLATMLIMVLFTKTSLSQQLRLGSNPWTVEKSAVLELQSTNQGLLFTRIADTALINALNPPDGMVVYFTPSKQLLVRANGYWQALTPTTSLNNYWSITGNSNGAVKQLGTIDNYALPFVTNNTERMRISNTGNVGIGTTTPSQKLDVNGTIVSSATTYPNYGYNTANRMAFGETNVPANETGSVVQYGSGSSSRNMLFAFTKTNVNTSFFGNDGTQMMLGSESTAPITFRTGLSYTAANIMGSGTEAMRINSTGVGIGTTSPSTKLHIVGTNPLTLIGVQAGTNTTADSLLTITNGLVRKLPLATFANAYTSGNLTETSSNVLTITGGTNAVLGSGATVQVKQAGSSQSGYLSSTDWTTFNTKLSSVDTSDITNFYQKVRGLQSAGTGITYNNTTGVISNAGVTSLNGNTGALTMDTGYISSFYQKVRGLFSATAPITLANGLIGITQASGSTNGYLSSTDWTTFNNKLSSVDTTSISNFYVKVRGLQSAGTGITYNNTTGVISNAGVTSLNGNTGALTMDTGYISNFYQKVRGLFSATAPITLTNGLIGITQASGSTNGYLSSTDWTTFNNKLSSVDTSNITNFYQKVRGLFSAGSGISYNSTTGVITAGASTNWTLNGNTVGALKTIGTVDSYDLPFITNNTEKMRITSAGKVGIGNTAPAEVLDVTGNLRFSGAIMPGGSAGTAGYVLTSAGAGSVPTWVAPTTVSNSWLLDGNSVSAMKNLGTITNYHLPFITNNTERMRITSTGNVGIGTSTFDGTNPEKFLVHAGTTSSYNLINAKGTINNYLQLNIQNLSSASAASSDVVATANNGSETVNFVDMGINSSGYSSTGILGGANNAYLYSTGNDFVIGNQTASKDLVFFTGGSAAGNERMRIDGDGKVGIGVTDAANQLVVKDTLEIRRTGTLSTLLFSNTSGYGDFRIGGDGGDLFWQGGGGRNLQMGSYWPTILMGDRQSSSFPAHAAGSSINTGVLVLGQRDASTPLAIQGYSASQSANLTEWRSSAGTVLDVVDETGRMAIGTSTFDASNPEKLLVDAGTTSSFNVISGKGSINNYLQLNIQNRSTGAAASSDVIATADNGSESVNFIDMGINSSGYSSSGVLGGANNAYLYSTGNDFVIGNSIASKNLRFFTGGTATGNERVRIDGTGNFGIATTAPTSKLDVNGSAGLGIVTTSSNLTLDETNYSVIITGGTPAITLPTASTCTRRMYVIVNQTAGARTITSYKNFSNAGTTTIAANSSITIQSDGSNWYRIQ